jgi:hypothetical protein
MRGLTEIWTVRRDAAGGHGPDAGVQPGDGPDAGRSARWEDIPEPDRLSLEDGTHRRSPGLVQGQHGALFAHRTAHVSAASIGTSMDESADGYHSIITLTANDIIVGMYRKSLMSD